MNGLKNKQTWIDQQSKEGREGGKEGQSNRERALELIEIQDMFMFKLFKAIQYHELY